MTVPKVSPEEEARQRRAKQLEQQAQEKKVAEAAAKEKVAQRQWILQYAEDDSESDPDEAKEEVRYGQHALHSGISVLHAFAACLQASAFQDCLLSHFWPYTPDFRVLTEINHNVDIHASMCKSAQAKACNVSWQLF